jgi:hypothetical protein
MTKMPSVARTSGAWKRRHFIGEDADATGRSSRQGNVELASNNTARSGEAPQSAWAPPHIGNTR